MLTRAGLTLYVAECTAGSVLVNWRTYKGLIALVRSCLYNVPMLTVVDFKLDTAKVRQLRLKLGLTMDAAAKAAGFSGRQQWYNLESGRSGKDVSVNTLGRLARVLNCSADDLLTTSDD